MSNKANRERRIFIDTAKLMDFFHVEESPYDPAFVAKIRKAEQSKKYIIDVKNIWD